MRDGNQLLQALATYFGAFTDPGGRFPQASGLVPHFYEVREPTDLMLRVVSQQRQTEALLSILSTQERCVLAAQFGAKGYSHEVRAALLHPNLARALVELQPNETRDDALLRIVRGPKEGRKAMNLVTLDLLTPILQKLIKAA